MSNKLTIKAMCGRYGVVDRTIDRWTEASILPPPLVINRRRYWDEEELEPREREGSLPWASERAHLRPSLLDCCRPWV